MEGELLCFYGTLWSNVPPPVVYDEFIRAVLGHLLRAIKRDGSTKKRKLQPL